MVPLQKGHWTKGTCRVEETHLSPVSAMAWTRNDADKLAINRTPIPSTPEIEALGAFKTGHRHAQSLGIKA